MLILKNVERVGRVLVKELLKKWFVGSDWTTVLGLPKLSNSIWMRLLIIHRLVDGGRGPDCESG